jgi:hypothetical protein
MSETRTRFLREIAARIPAERLVEIHLFPPMKQGTIESGMAVVAATPEPVEPELPAADTVPGPDAAPADVVAALDGEEQAGDAPLVRHTVYTARYRATLKGADRGKWEFSLVAEADAPLVTVDAVVRGVQRRSADAAEPERLTPESLPAMDEESWPISTP